MCGISGVFASTADLGPAHGETLSRLNDGLRRRGPDGEGQWRSRDGAVILGNRRLAIIDIGPGGAQPMTDVSGRWTITFNGEIYNYRELRTELERLGSRFASRSDTEILIQTVAQWGVAGLRRLRGMYAFALWDDREKELWLGRDPYGIKPLYIARGGGVLWFASQARALANCAPIDTRRDPAALTGFYLWGYVPEPFSWWRGIEPFPPGHVQRFRVGGTETPPQCFSSIPELYAGVTPRPADPGELRAALADSVRAHLVADIPVGMFLSAGIDSNVIAALASELGHPPRTITLAFEEYAGTDDDEAPLAALAARTFGTDHVTVRVARSEFDAMIDDFFAAMDQPSTDGLNSWLLARAAAMEGLKVVVSGLGGDELFGGYPSFRQLPLLIAAGRTLPAARRVGELLRRSMRQMLPRNVSPKLAAAMSYSGDLGAAYLLRRSLYLTEELSLLLDESWLREGLERLSTDAAIAAMLAPLKVAGIPAHAQISALESCWYMRNQLLRDTDWAGMAHGVEIRVPYVDTEFLAALAPAVASSRPPGKRDIAACVGALPPAIRSRRKTGFTTPVRTWTKGGNRVSPRGLRGWADTVHRQFRATPNGRAPEASPAA
jgi:asparagine synthase (glutamine-hydrolysing)